MAQKNRLFKIFYIRFILFFICSLSITGEILFIKNTLKDIEECEGKIKLTLIRVWGEEDSDDNNQYFRFPRDIKIRDNNNVYIADSGNNRIQVFDRSAKYLETLGRRGQGPADLLCPTSLAFDSLGKLIVADYENLRIQAFDEHGKYAYSFRTLKSRPSLVALTKKSKIAVYSHMDSFKTKSLIQIYNQKGVLTGKIGKPNKTAQSIAEMENAYFTLDPEDNFLISFYMTPLIKKFDSQGKELWISTFETPLKTPVIEFDKNRNETKVSGPVKLIASAGISVDQVGRIFIATAIREKKKNEKFFLVGGSGSDIRKVSNNPLPDDTDMYRLLVFDKSGKIFAAKRLIVYCDQIYVHKDTLFIIDTYVGMKIFEYRISFNQDISK